MSSIARSYMHSYMHWHIPLSLRWALASGSLCVFEFITRLRTVGVSFSLSLCRPGFAILCIASLDFRLEVFDAA